MGALELYSQGSRWTDTTVRAAFPIVLRRAMDGDPIEYGELNEAVAAQGKKRVLPIAYRYVAGKIGDICEALGDELQAPVPPLNAIIVNVDSQLPSHGVNDYLVRFLRIGSKEISRLSKDDRDNFARAAMRAVWNFDGWDLVRQHLQIRLADVRTKQVNRGRRILSPNPRNFATGPESKAHKDFKTWVSEHPELFISYGKFSKGRNETVISSGDRLDVLFRNRRTMLAVEVKAKGSRGRRDDELQRGVYQCVKYRATLQAMQLADIKPPNAQAVLVIDHKPSTVVSDLAARLSVHVITVGKPR